MDDLRKYLAEQFSIIFSQMKSMQHQLNKRGQDIDRLTALTEKHGQDINRISVLMESVKDKAQLALEGYSLLKESMDRRFDRVEREIKEIRSIIMYGHRLPGR